MPSRPRSVIRRAFPFRGGTRSNMMVLALLAGLFLLAPLLCGTHHATHDEMGISHGICASVTTLAVGAALTIPLVYLPSILSLAPFLLAVPPLIDPITKPPQ